MWGLVEGLQARGRVASARARLSTLKTRARTSDAAARGTALRPRAALRSPCPAQAAGARVLTHRAQIGLPPVLHFGSPALKARVAPECLQVRPRAATSQRAQALTHASAPLLSRL